MDLNNQMSLARPLNIESDPMDTSQSEMSLSRSSTVNGTVGSLVTDLNSTWDCTAAMESEDDQTDDDESEDETFSRQDNRTCQCKFCPEIFRHLQDIRKHTKMQHPSEWKNILRKCVHCKRQFPSGLLHDRHVHFHSLDHPFKCTECDQMYPSKKNLEKHFQVFHDRNSRNFSTERFHCGSCELTFVERKYCDLHSTIYHKRKPQRLKNLSDKIKVCVWCVKTFDSQNLLREHIWKTHQDDHPLKNCICKICSKDLKTLGLLRIHYLVVHFGVKPFVCQHCNAEFSTRRLLLRHMEKDHSEVALFKCPSCDESFPTESIMTEHKDRVHKDKVPVQLEIDYDPQTGKPVYPCGKCEKMLESKTLLDKHLVKAHPSYMLMYKCPLCSHSVRYRKQHMRVHHYLEHDAKEHHYLVRYKCHCCSKLFQKKRKLLDHQHALSMQCGRCQMRFKTKKSLQAHMATHLVNKSLKCEDCGLDFGYRCRLEEHWKRYHSPTSSQVLKIINCPYCPKLFTTVTSCKSHIATKHVPSEFRVNCGHCPVQVTDSAVQLRKHYTMMHPKERVTFKCPECDKFYLNLNSFKDHYKKHRKEAGSDEKAEVNSTSQPVEDGVKESGQMNDQIAEGELISIVIKEEAIVQIENASAAGVGVTTRNDNSMNTNQPSEQGMMLEIKQEPLDNGEPATSPVLIEEEKSTAAERTSEQKSVMIEKQKFDFVEAGKDVQESTREPMASEQSEPSVEQQVVSTESDSEEKRVLLLTEERKQEEHMEVDESCKCPDCGLFFHRRRFEEHRKRYHSPTSTQVLKIINCPYCPQLFTTLSTQKRHITVKHVRSESKVNCGHCPVQVTDTVQLRKHYKMVHPEARVTFKCPECVKFYLYRHSFNDHYKKHRKGAGSDDKADMNSTSEPVEDGVKESGQTNNQTADAELESIVVNEEAFFQSEPVEYGVNKDDLNANGELESIVIKEESIVQIGNAAAFGVNVAAGIKDSSFNTDTHSEQRVMIEIKQEPLDNGEAANSTDLAEEDQSTDAEGRSEQKSAAIEEQQDIPIASDAEEKPVLLATQEQKQEEQMDVDETVKKIAAEESGFPVTLLL